MRILIVNPNSNPDMTRTIAEAARSFSAGEFEVVCRATPGAPPFIETYEDQAQAAPGMIGLLRDNQEAFDAFVVACHCDPKLDLMKEVSRKPVVELHGLQTRLGNSDADGVLQRLQARLRDMHERSLRGGLQAGLLSKDDPGLRRPLGNPDD